MGGEFVFSEQELKKVILPLARKITNLYKKGETTIIGIQGGQGTGKTTLVNFLKEHLISVGYKVESFSIDDFYFSYKKRKQLAKKNKNNPFYQIPRGMPGTHKIRELKGVLTKSKQGKSFQIPIFDKSKYSGWGEISEENVKIKERQDFVLFEGWFVGMPYTSSKRLVEICKKKKISLKKIDPELKYHKLVLQNVKRYKPIWSLFDYMVMLKPNSPNLHKMWRNQQELELKKATGEGMDKEEIDHFVSIYLPFTYLCYELIKPDVKIFINKNHDFTKFLF